MKEIIEENVRIDKWLWATRVFKTRSLAANACKNNQVSVNGVWVKPSRTLNVGDVVGVKMPPITRTYNVLGLLAQRQSAKIVADYIEDVTPESEIEILQMVRLQRNAYRDPGSGRPTKKERRDLEEFGYI